MGRLSFYVLELIDMRKVLVLTAAVLLLFLASCSRIEDIENFTSPQASLDAPASSSILNSVPIQSDDQPLSNVPAATAETDKSESDAKDSSSETLPEADPLQPIREGFSFPDEFGDRLNEMLDRYYVNLNCDPETEPCGCKPEAEPVAEEGAALGNRVVSLYYCDLESGYEIYVNSGVHYPVASTVKIPFCILVYDRIASGDIDPEMVLTYEKRHYFGGSGVIVKGDFGQQFTVLELLELAITRSDNVAYEMLKDLVSWDDFRQFLSDNGMTHEEDLRRYKQKICPESAKTYGMILKDFLLSDNSYVETLKEDLLETRNKMIVSQYPVYRKYGWTNYAFHDIAYIDAPHPYIFAVLSNMNGEKDDYALIKELSYLFEEYAMAE